MNQALLAAKSISKKYGSFVAMEDVSLNVFENEFLSIVGPNGAGKTTLLNVLTGLHKPSSGYVTFNGKDISGLNPVDLSTRGLARAFQLVSYFPDLTVRETLAVAAASHLNIRWGMFQGIFQRQSVTDIVVRTAKAFGLTSVLDTPAKALPHGRRKLLDVASALALHPEVILLDEPTAGVSTADKHGVMETLIAAASTMNVKAIVLVEHDMDLVSRYSTRIVAMQNGRKLADLPRADFFADDEVLSVVIGKEVSLTEIMLPPHDRNYHARV